MQNDDAVAMTNEDNVEMNTFSDETVNTPRGSMRIRTLSSVDPEEDSAALLREAIRLQYEPVIPERPEDEPQLSNSQTTNHENAFGGTMNTYDEDEELHFITSDRVAISTDFNGNLVEPTDATQEVSNNIDRVTAIKEEIKNCKNNGTTLTLPFEYFKNHYTEIEEDLIGLIFYLSGPVPFRLSVFGGGTLAIYSIGAFLADIVRDRLPMAVKVLHQENILGPRSTGTRVGHDIVVSMVEKILDDENKIEVIESADLYMLKPRIMDSCGFDRSYISFVRRHVATDGIRITNGCLSVRGAYIPEEFCNKLSEEEMQERRKELYAANLVRYIETFQGVRKEAAEQELHDKSMQFYQQARNISMRIKANDSGLETEFKEALEDVLSLPQIDSIDISGDFLVVRTNDIFLEDNYITECPDEWEGSIYEDTMGKFQFMIDMKNRRISISNLTYTDKYYPHPNVNGENQVCWGNLKTASQVAMSKLDIYESVVLCVRLMSSYGHSNPYIRLDSWRTGIEDRDGECQCHEHEDWEYYSENEDNDEFEDPRDQEEDESDENYAIYIDNRPRSESCETRVVEYRRCDRCYENDVDYEQPLEYED